MKYIRAFLSFWRKFIVGDDSRIAVTIMWSLLLVNSLTLNFINGWFVLPGVIIILLSLLTYDSVSPRQRTKKQLSRMDFLLTGTLPMLIVTALPLILSRGIYGTWSLQNTLLPFSIYIVFSVLLSVIIYLLLRAFPVLYLFLLGFASFILITFWQSAINRFSQDFLTSHETAATLLAIVVVAGFFAGCLGLLFYRRKVMTTANAEN